MIYQVMLSENQSVLIENVNHVSTDDETVRFCEKGGSLVAAFKMYNIVGFFRMDMPNEKAVPKYEWDFDMINEITEEQQREAEKRAAYKKENFYNYIREQATMMKEQKLYSGINDLAVEVTTEAMERQTYIKGSDIYLYERKFLKELLKENMDKCIGAVSK
jgi:hypothetical protein